MMNLWQWLRVGGLLLLGSLLAAGNQARAERDLLPSVTVDPSNVLVKLTSVGPASFISDMAVVPDGSGRTFLTSLASGEIRVLDAGGNLLSTPYHTMANGTTIIDRDTGFTAMAFHPGFANPLSTGFGKFYTLEPENTATGAVTYNPQFASSGTHHYDVLYEYTVGDPSANTIGSFSKRAVIRARQTWHNHNLNDLVFDSDELLYIGSGDGGNSSTERRNAEQLTTPYGKVLRIDPLGLQGTPSANGQFSIPGSNPFVGDGGGVYEEIFTYGHRNPYRLSIDPATNDLLVAEVGQDDVEEINLIPNVTATGSGGGDYGWHHKEGSILFPSFQPDADNNGNGNGDIADANGWIDPVLEYDHEDGADVIGGFVYHDAGLPGLDGKYVFADHQGSRDVSEPIPNVARLFYGDLSSGVSYEFNVSAFGEELPARIISLGQGPSGEMYVSGYDANFGNPRLLRIEPALLGDYNDDLSVDAADYVIWRNSLGMSGAGLAADGNFDGQVDAADYGIWKSHFGNSLLAPAALTGSSVPEPASLLLLVMACGALARVVRQ